MKSIIFGVILLVATPSLVYSNTLTYKEGDASPEILEPYLPPRGEEYYLDPPKMLPKDKVRLA